MKLHYVQSTASLLEGSRLNYDWLRLALLTGVVFGVLMSLSYIGEALNGERGYLSVVIIAIGEGVFFGLFMTLAMRFVLLPFQIRRIFRQNPKVFGPATLDLDDQGFAFATEAVQAKFQWADMRGFKENAKVVVLGVSKTVAYSVPKDELTPLQIDDLIALLERRLKRLR